MTKNQLIYLGSPYSHSDEAVRQERYDKVLHLTADLLNQGFHIISPIVHCHPLSIKYSMRGDFDFWQKYNFALLSKCDVLLIFPLDGWKESIGLQAEIKYAKKNKISVEILNV